jgi:hypothetical protein
MEVNFVEGTLLSKSRRFVSLCFLMLAFACNFAQTQDSEGQFQLFFSKFKEAVRANDVTAIADSINFPFYVYSFKHSRAEFLSNKDESINIFNEYLRSQILRSNAKDFIAYRNKKEMDEDKPDFGLIPESSPVIELDIINARGGPAMRLVFARTGSGYKLFCLVQ